MMIKHGWDPILTTDKELCGPTRAGGIFCLGKYTAPPSSEEFSKLIETKNEPVKDILNKFDELDKKWS